MFDFLKSTSESETELPLIKTRIEKLKAELSDLESNVWEIKNPPSINVGDDCRVTIYGKLEGPICKCIKCEFIKYSAGDHYMYTIWDGKSLSTCSMFNLTKVNKKGKKWKK